VRLIIAPLAGALIGPSDPIEEMGPPTPEPGERVMAQMAMIQEELQEDVDGMYGDPASGALRFPPDLVRGGDG
jgi:hypothetical protein